ncbi:MAG: hypothetical protein AAF408_09435 [Pseudomonadota bacterium]
MNTALPLFLIGLIFGGGIGFTIAAANGITLDGHDHSDAAHHAENHSAQVVQASASATATHDHATALVLPVSDDAPSLDIDVIKDPAAGWNLHIQTANFSFSPKNASRDHVPGEGHAHVYVNGAKLGRYYGPWVHLDQLPKGDVQIEVTLNANDHRPLTVGEAALAASVTLRN